MYKNYGILYKIKVINKNENPSTILLKISWIKTWQTKIEIANELTIRFKQTGNKVVK